MEIRPKHEAGPKTLNDSWTRIQLGSLSFEEPAIGDRHCSPQRSWFIPYPISKVKVASLS